MFRVFVLDIATLFDRNRVDDRNRDFEKKLPELGPFATIVEEFSGQPRDFQAGRSAGSRSSVGCSYYK